MSKERNVVIAGEASESSSEEADDCGEDVEIKDELVVDLSSVNKSTNESRPVVPKHNSLLHKKLREKNMQLHNNFKAAFQEAYTTASKDLHSITSTAHKSQRAMKEIKETMSLVSNDLFKLEDLVDTISSCAILPEFRLPTAELSV